jgi:hypothetical protein
MHRLDVINICWSILYENPSFDIRYSKVEQFVGNVPIVMAMKLLFIDRLDTNWLMG